MRYPVSGANATAINEATVSSATPILVPTSGRIFWLRGISVRASATVTGHALRILDASAAGTATSFSLVMTLPMATGASTLGAAAIADSVINFGPPGIKFATGCAANSSTTAVIEQFGVAVWGYEE